MVKNMAVKLFTNVAFYTLQYLSHAQVVKQVGPFLLKDLQYKVVVKISVKAINCHSKE